MTKRTQVRVILDLRTGGGPIQGLVSVPASSDELARLGRLVHGWMELAHTLESARRSPQPEFAALQQADAGGSSLEQNLEPGDHNDRAY